MAQWGVPSPHPRQGTPPSSSVPPAPPPSTAEQPLDTRDDFDSLHLRASRGPEREESLRTPRPPAPSSPSVAEGTRSVTLQDATPNQPKVQALLRASCLTARAPSSGWSRRNQRLRAPPAGPPEHVPSTPQPRRPALPPASPPRSSLSSRAGPAWGTGLHPRGALCPREPSPGTELGHRSVREPRRGQRGAAGPPVRHPLPGPRVARGLPGPPRRTGT